MASIWVPDVDLAPLHLDEGISYYEDASAPLPGAGIIDNDKVLFPAFDLSTIPAEVDEEKDLKVFQLLLREEIFNSYMLYVGRPTRNLVVPKDAIPFRTSREVLILGFTTDGGAPTIQGKVSTYRPE